MKPSLVIVGLGNPGKQYEHTRHNVGFQAMDHLAKAWEGGDWEEKQKFAARTCEARLITVPILLVKPTTFMNLTGESVRKLVDFFKLDATQQILMVSDDIDLPLGEVRLRMKGGPGTHNGLKSVVDTLGEDFPRIRIGIGTQPQGQDLAAWVLSAMTKEEAAALEGSYAKLPEMIREYVMQTSPTSPRS